MSNVNISFNLSMCLNVLLNEVLVFSGPWADHSQGHSGRTLR